MNRKFHVSAVVGGLLLALSAADPASAQKQGGVLRMPHGDSPASMSILEESTIAAEAPMMGVFNNLVMFDQHVAQNSLKSIVPDLAISWSWNEEGTELTLPLPRQMPFSNPDCGCRRPARSDEDARQRASVLPGCFWRPALGQVRR